MSYRLEPVVVYSDELSELRAADSDRDRANEYLDRCCAPPGDLQSRILWLTDQCIKETRKTIAFDARRKAQALRDRCEPNHSSRADALAEFASEIEGSRCTP